MLDGHQSFISGTSCFNMKRMGQWFLLGLLLAPAAYAQPMRPSEALRTAGTDRHEIIIQKNGRVDVFGLGRTLVFENVFPMIWFEGDDHPISMRIDGRYTARRPIKDPLGIGQELYFEKAGYEWSIRVYPLQPFITVSCAYTNRSKRDVQIRGLAPWCGGEPKKGGVARGFIGPETLLAGGDKRWTSPLAQRMRLDASSSHGFTQFMVAGDMESGNHVLMAYLDQGEFEGAAFFENTITVSPTTGATGFRAMAALPRTVSLAPGDRIESPSIYVSLTENELISSLGRYGEALALWAGHGQPSAAVHGWYETDPEIVDRRWNELGFTDFLPKETSSHVSVANDAPPRWTWGPAELTPDVNWFRESITPQMVERIRERGDEGEYAVVFLSEQPMAVGASADGCVYDLTEDILGAMKVLRESFFYAPNAHRPILLMGDSRDRNRMERLLTLAAISGARVYLPGALHDSETAQTLSGRAFGSNIPRGIPIGLIPESMSNMWYTTSKLAGGTVWHVAVFNTEATATNRDIPLSAIGIDPRSLASVYDVWRQSYLGTARGTITVEVPPHGVRLLALQIENGSPTLLAVGDGIDLGAKNVKSRYWDPATGTFAGHTDVGAHHRVLIPETMEVIRVKSGDEQLEHSVEGRILHFDAAADTTWEVSLSRK